MARMLHVVGLGLLAVLAGCVSQDQYAALKLQKEKAENALAFANSERDRAMNEAEVLRSQLANSQANGAGNTALAQNAMDRAQLASQERDEWMRKYEELLRSRSNTVALPKQLNDALVQFANANPDIVAFDPQRGLVKFKSDVTFASGDATLTAKAKDVIAQFAQIPSSAAAGKFELLVAGHTDNTPVTRKETMDKGHKDNWYLSSHRAITVGKELLGLGLNPQRLGVIGYAEFRPTAPNSTSEGKAQNRRVEVAILPSQLSGGTISATPARSTSARTAAAPKTDLNKDTASVNPALNK